MHLPMHGVPWLGVEVGQGFCSWNPQPRLLKAGLQSCVLLVERHLMVYVVCDSKVIGNVMMVCVCVCVGGGGLVHWGVSYALKIRGAVFWQHSYMANTFVSVCQTVQLQRQIRLLLHDAVWVWFQTIMGSCVLHHMHVVQRAF